MITSKTMQQHFYKLLCEYANVQDNARNLKRKISQALIITLLSRRFMFYAI